MVSSVDMSLEDIIKTNKIKPGNRRGGGNAGRGGRRPPQQRGGGSSGFGGRRGGGGGIPNRPMSNPPRGNIDARWSHDLYQGPPPRSGPVKLQITNLDFGVSDTDVQELFSEFGPLRNAVIHYDRSGRSLGTGHVTFDRHGDALRAQRKYNGVRLDGRTMKLTIEGAAAGAARRIESRPVKRLGQGPGPRMGGNRPSRGGRGRRGGGAGGRDARGKVPTAEELDAELDAYVNQANK